VGKPDDGAKRSPPRAHGASARKERELRQEIADSLKAQRHAAIEEALAALEKHWTLLELEAKEKGTGRGRANANLYAIKRRTMRSSKCMDRIDEHVRLAQVEQAAEGQRLLPAALVEMVKEFARGLFDE
jgi:predicted NACHT family NTPase